MADSSPRLVSVQRGRVRVLGSWTTAFFQEPVPDPVWVASGGLAGCQHADPRFHGGPEKAVLACRASPKPPRPAEAAR